MRIIVRILSLSSSPFFVSLLLSDPSSPEYIDDPERVVPPAEPIPPDEIDPEEPDPVEPPIVPPDHHEHDELAVSYKRLTHFQVCEHGTVSSCDCSE